MAASRSKPAALFIRRAEEEAERIRRAAQAERRTLSGFVLNAVFNRIQMRDKMVQPAAALQTRAAAADTHRDKVLDDADSLLIKRGRR
jgi:uncharacterized protein DUF1778